MQSIHYYVLRSSQYFCSNDLHRSNLTTSVCPDLQAFMNAIHPFLLYPFYLDMALEFSKESIILLVVLYSVDPFFIGWTDLKDVLVL